jgi:hypothetical protein
MLKEEEEMTYLSELMGSIQHRMCSAPTDIAVERDLEGGANSALNLQLVEVLDTSARGLNLTLVTVRLQ